MRDGDIAWPASGPAVPPPAAGEPPSRPAGRWRGATRSGLVLLAGLLTVGLVLFQAGGRPPAGPSAGGLRSASPAAPAGGPVTTSFGTLTVDRVGQEDARSGGHGDQPHTGAGDAEHAWTDAVRITLTLVNRLSRPVPFSPGQVRLRVGERGPSVAPLDAGRPAGALPDRASLRTWVSFLVPPNRADLMLQFADVETGRVLRVPLPERDEGGHR
jgi:hypothetical protein